MLTAVAGLAGLSASPLVASGTATAGPPTSPCFAAFTASAAADLLALRHLDLSPLGLSTGQPTGVLVGASRAGLFAGANPLAAARAGLIPPSSAGYVYQVAPPTSQDPAARSTGAIDDGRVFSGAHTLRAAAALRDSAVCDEATGPVAQASDDVTSDSGLEGRDRSVLQLPGGTTAVTRTMFVSDFGRYSAQASASTVLTDLHLFGGTTTVRVSSQPALRVAASGTASTSLVEYTAPVLTIAVPGSPGEFRAVGSRVDLVAPLDASGEDAAAAVAAAQGSPVLPTTAFGDLLAALGAGPSGPAAGRVAIVRVSPGGLAKQNTGSAVHALTSAIRIQVLLRTPGADGGSVDRQLTEFAIGTVEVLAYAPSGGYVRPGSATAPAVPNTTTGTTANGTAVAAGGPGPTSGTASTDDSANTGNTTTGPAGTAGRSATAEPGTAGVGDTTAAGWAGNAGRDAGTAPGGGYGGGEGEGVDGSDEDPTPLHDQRTMLIIGAVAALVLAGRLAGVARLRHALQVLASAVGALRTFVGNAGTRRNRGVPGRHSRR